MGASSMWISPKYRAADWTALDLSKESGWKAAVAILRDRMNGRFFSIVEQIQTDGFSGFAVLALDCLLIESLQQFREGVDTTPPNKCREYFENFLTQTSFGEHFSNSTAAKFYDQFRCGILHQAEIKKTSKVHRSGALVQATPDGEGLIINRKKFHSELRRVFAAYLDGLLDGANLQLRNNFKRKMDYICRAGTG
jgi:hypothetical protein